MFQTDGSSSKSLVASFVHGVRDQSNGTSFQSLMWYFVPEFITTLVIYFLPIFIDLAFIGNLKSTSAISSLGVTNTWLHLITKIADGLSIGVVILGGKYNGAGEYKKVGRTLTDAFWLTIIIGGLFFCFFFFGASFIYAHVYGVTSAKMIRIGVPYLQLRAVGILLTFIYFAAVGFLRSIKNNRLPMIIYAMGAVVFVFVDWVLIFGKWGVPALGLQGSAWATVIQAAFMMIIVYSYIFINPQYRKYGISLFRVWTDGSAIHRLLSLSWRVVIDKATMALAYIWLSKMLAMNGKYGIASFTAIRTMQQFVVLPALAFAQVITFIVSNEIGAQNWSGIKSSVKKVFFLSVIMVGVLTLLLWCNPILFLSFIDAKGKFSSFSAAAFPFISLLAMLDLLQLILSGALRGAANVNLVMWVRLIVIICFFVPVSYILRISPMQSDLLKFILIYGTYYVGTGIMNIVYTQRFRSGAWKKHMLGDDA